MIEELLGILIAIPFIVILWEVAIIFGKIIYDDYIKEDEIEFHLDE